MAEFVELYFGGGAGFDVSSGRATSVYRLDTDFPTQDPRTVPGVPAYGSPHPRFTDVRLDSIQFSDPQGPAESGSGYRYIATLNYSNNRSLRYAPRVHTDRETHKAYNFVSRTTEVVVPTFARRKAYVPNSIVPTNLWERQDMKIRSCEFMLEVNLNFISATFDVSNQTLIDNQMNKLHDFGGKWWQFIGGNSRLSETLPNTNMRRVELTYAWMRPAIVPAITLPAGFDDRLWAPNFALLPFFNYQVIPDTTMANGAPLIVSVSQGDYSQPQGYQTLPGNPI